jgi:hypothetical protein
MRSIFRKTNHNGPVMCTEYKIWFQGKLMKMKYCVLSVRGSRDLHLGNIDISFGAESVVFQVAIQKLKD